MITGFFGLPGVGKSTMLAKVARKELKRIKRGKSKYTQVLTNYSVKGCKRFDFHQLGKYDMSGSLVLIDEITMDADNRDFKRFSNELRNFFILHRHYGIDVVYFTQNWNAVDKKIRDLTYDLYYLKKILWWTVGTRIFRCLDINTETKEIVQGYRFPNLWERVKSWIFPMFSINVSVFRPFWYKYFDSFDAPALPEFEYKEW